MLTGTTVGFSVNRTAKSMAVGKRMANRSLLLVVVEETTDLPFEEAGPIGVAPAGIHLWFAAASSGR
jgi:hypothetical protein